MMKFLIGGISLAVFGLIVAAQPELQVLLRDWQSLIAGLIAIGAAIIGGAYVQAQTRLTDQHEQDRIRRQFDSNRALLPLTLSKMSAYARESVTALRAIYPAGAAEAVNTNIDLPIFPDPPEAVVQQLVALIGASRDASIRVHVAELLSRLQVQSARMLDLRHMREWGENRIFTRSELDEYLLNAADIYARCSNLFDYARRESNVVPNEPTAPNLSSSLNQLGLRDQAYPRVHARLVQMAARQG